jgi:SAM-dependent methyltransferase
MTPTLDFAYPWWLSYAHLTLALILLPVVALAFLRQWPAAARIGLLLVGIWAVVAAVGVYRFGANRVPVLPTDQFLADGAGRVLDFGAGTGRSTIMVLRERPQAQLVALDLFGESFTQHFGEGPRPEDRLLANLRAAGVESRATIQAGDMLDLPFQDDEFDAVVSAYAMDHVGGDGARRALAEAKRVLRPGGQFLLMLVHSDVWTTVAFGPALVHSGVRDQAWWRAAAVDAGFTVVEEGTAPATMFLLLRE